MDSEELEEYDADEVKDLVTQLFTENKRLTEGLDRVAAMFKIEDAGWVRLDKLGNDIRGLELEELQQWSEQIREAMVGNAHIKRGASLRSTYVLDGGIHHDKIPEESRGRRRNGQPRNVKELMNDPLNQRNFFGEQARIECNSALYSDGIYIVVGNDDTRKIEMNLPIWEIGAEYRNPNIPSEIWAYRRDWNYYPPGQSDQPVARKEWIWTDTFWDQRVDTIIAPNGERENVSPNLRAFDMMVNTQAGWAYGVPDALSALAWARLYRDFLTNGKVVSDAMMQFIFKSTVNSDQGASRAGVKINEGGYGKTALLGLSNGLEALSTAGKSFDFDGGRPLAAVVATALEVSVIHLTSDPGTAGSSYGSAQTLDLPTRLAVTQRRSLLKDFEKRVLRWMGASDADVWFVPIIDYAEYFRAVQGIVMKWGTGLYSPEDIRGQFEALQGKWGPIVGIPDGVMLPNNENSIMRRDIDPNTSGNGVPGEPAPGVGQNSPAGEGLESDDI